jgi:hypothetical protein
MYPLSFSLRLLDLLKIGTYVIRKSDADRLKYTLQGEVKVGVMVPFIYSWAHVVLKLGLFCYK